MFCFPLHMHFLWNDAASCIVLMRIYFSYCDIDRTGTVRIVIRFGTKILLFTTLSDSFIY